MRVGVQGSQFPEVDFAAKGVIVECLSIDLANIQDWGMRVL